MQLDARSRFHLLGVVVGVIVTVWAAVQGDWLFAAAFGVGSLFLGLGVAHRIRQEQRNADEPPA